MKNEYLVMPKDRTTFYNNMHNLGYKDKYFNSTYINNSKFPFYLNTKAKEITVLESITVCACAASRDQIISDDQFYISNNIIIS